MNSLKGKLIPKLKATLAHLGLSLLVFVVILYFILFEWYPEPFFTAQGGWQGIRLMAFVDLVLGPFLTLVVFDHLKSRRAIALDMSLIVLVQVAALIWGGYQVYSQRAVALVYWGSAFYSVTGVDYKEQGIQIPDFSEFSDAIPPVIYSKPVSTIEELVELNKLTERKIPAYAHVFTYRNIYDHLESILEGSVDIREIMSMNEVMAKELKEITSEKYDDYYYIPLKAKYRNMILVVTESGHIIGEVVAPL